MHYREYIKATGINLLFTFAIFIYYPVLSPYIKSVGLDNFQLALIFSILPLVTIFLLQLWVVYLIMLVDLE